MSQKDFHHPFQPYDIQQQFMSAVYDCIENGQVGIFESPTGTGKSLSLICGSLTWLREHKRKTFDKAMQNIEADDDEPDWMLEHARATKRKEALQMRAEFEERLAKVREQERKLRERHTNGEPLKKRRKPVESTTDSEAHAEAQFELDDYHSDEESASTTSGNGGYSAETTKLLEKLGMLLPDAREKGTVEMDDELKIFFCSRTHSQLTQFVGELQRVKLPPGLPPETESSEASTDDLSEAVKQITLGSRMNLCINPKVSRLSSQTAINERCIELQQSKNSVEHKCAYLPNKESEDVVLNFRDHALSSIRDIEDLAAVGKKLGICPYYASRPAIAPAEIVTLPYPLLLQKTAREALGISLKNHIVIIDEAHNLMDAVESTYSAQVTEQQLRFSRESIMTYLQKFRNKLKGSNRVYVTQLVRVIDSMLQFIAALISTKVSSGTMPASALLVGKAVDQINVSKLVRYISESKLARKVEGYAAHLKQIEPNVKQVADHAPEPQTPILTHVQNFLRTLLNPSKEGRFFWSKDEEATTVRYILLDPSAHFRDIVTDARAVILAGGTMSPVDDYTQQLFPYLPSISTLSCGHIIPTTNLLARAISTDFNGPLSFNFKTRSSTNLIDRLGYTLLSLLPHIAGGTVVFFASYAYLTQVQSHWTNTPTLANLSFIKPTFFDSRTTPTETTFAAYSAAVTPDPAKGALLFSVLGGRLSEGINFSDALGRCVIVVGLPYPNLQTPEWQAKIEYLDARAAERGELKGKAGREHAENVCMRAVNQAIGRVIRHKNDWASILLLDSRYAEARVQEKLPGWIRESLPSVEKQSGRVEDVVRDVGAFFAARQDSAGGK